MQQLDRAPKLQETSFLPSRVVVFLDPVRREGGGKLEETLERDSQALLGKYN
jgi:hypothetical protein